MVENVKIHSDKKESQPSEADLNNEYSTEDFTSADGMYPFLCSGLCIL